MDRQQRPALRLGIKQLKLFRVAVMFFTRIPVGEIKDFQTSDLNHATRFFTWVGALVGLINAVAYYVLSLVFDQEIAVLLSMALGFLLTGCFHEDGLADTVDGFGGGYTVQRKLDIMKDSCQGTYGVAALWTALTLKWLLLSKLDAGSVPLAIVVSHTFARFVPTMMIKLMTYTRDENSKSKPLATQITWSDVAVGAIMLLPGFAIAPRVTLFLVPLLTATYLLLARFGKRQIGGYTGDVLGAAEQISELVIYATWVAL